MPDEHPRPSEHARSVVVGSYDLHVHVAPDVMPRRTDDLTLARRCAETGIAGFVLKSHYVPTAERAAVVRSAVPGTAAMGAITLNNSVGGMNPAAVEIAAREGARVVWMPTVDSVNQRTSSATDPGNATPPVWASFQADLAGDEVIAPPVAVVDEDGRVLPGVRQVMSVIARHHIILATGHLSRDEIFAVVDCALDLGVKHMVVTHPEFTSQRLSIADQKRLAAKGALLERCFTTPYTRKVTWEHMIEAIRAVGPEHSVLSTDLGQTFNPPVEDGLPLLVDRLLAAGFDERAIRLMSRDNPQRLLEE